MKAEMKKVIQKAANGDEKAFLKLYDRYYKQFYYLAMKITKNANDAADVAQDTFMQIHVSLKDLRNIDYFNAWASRIVFTKCTKLFAKNKTTSLDPEIIKTIPNQKELRIDFNPESKLHFKNDKEVLMHFIDELSIPQKEAILLLYFEQLSCEEAASVLDIPEGTVKSRAKLARDILRKKIELYQRQEGKKLDFKLDAFELFITSCLAEEFVAVSTSIMIPAATGFVIPKSNLSHWTSITKGLSAVGVSGAVALGGAVMIDKASNPITPMQITPLQHRSFVNEKVKFSALIIQREHDGGIEKIQNAFDAYYTLKAWAYDEEILSGKKQDEILKYKVVYDELKHVEGVYWEMLKHDGWNEIFEKYAYE